MNPRVFVWAICWVALLVAAACSSDSSPPGSTVGVSIGSGSGASSSSSSGSSSGAATSSGGNSAGNGSSSGGALSGSSSNGGLGGSSGADASAGGTGSSNDASSSDASSSGAMAGTVRHGMSIGCGKAPGAAGAQRVMIPKCPAGCSALMGNCARDCIAPEFAPGGVSAGSRDFTNRGYSMQLPAGYQQTTAYPVFLGGGGCGSGGGGFAPPGANGILVNLAILDGSGPDGTCFADGGQACSAIGTNASLSVCVNSPEMAYVRAILNYVESNFCVDLDREFIGGVSSGAWETYTVGCGDADQLRGIAPNAGGKREHRWPCTGPQAALMIVNSGDTENPVVTGGLEPHLDSYGSAAARDELLMRNGCQMTDNGTMYDAAFPLCLKYPSCPAAYPVVWCELNGGHTNTNEAGIDYSRAIWPFLMSLPPTP
jgi:polyhydroxybutyrate depolymerase